MRAVNLRGTCRPLSESLIHLLNSLEGGGGFSASYCLAPLAERLCTPFTATERMIELVEVAGTGAGVGAGRTAGAGAGAALATEDDEAVREEVRPGRLRPGMMGRGVGAAEGVGAALTATVVHEGPALACGDYELISSTILSNPRETTEELTLAAAA